MKHPLDTTVTAPMPFARAASTFREDPARVSAVPSQRREAGRWGLCLWAGELGLHVDCALGAPRCGDGAGGWRAIPLGA